MRSVYLLLISVACAAHAKTNNTFPETPSLA
jgi:hypothetical protein